MQQILSADSREQTLAVKLNYHKKSCLVPPEGSYQHT